MTPSTVGRNRIVLCVEDHQDTCEMLTVALGIEGCKTDSAATMKEGLAKAREGNYDLILLDWYYEDSTGLELCRKIREFDEHTPIIFYSGVSEESHIKEAVEAGAQEYLVKPVGIDELLQKVVQYIGIGKTYESNQ